jgi:hypothetical protein
MNRDRRRRLRWLGKHAEICDYCGRRDSGTPLWEQNFFGDLACRWCDIAGLGYWSEVHLPDAVIPSVTVRLRRWLRDKKIRTKEIVYIPIAWWRDGPAITLAVNVWPKRECLWCWTPFWTWTPWRDSSCYCTDACWRKTEQVNENPWLGDVT